MTIAHYLGLTSKWVDRRLLVHDPRAPRRRGYGSQEQLAMVSVVQREWAAKNPRSTFKAPITAEAVTAAE